MLQRHFALGRIRLGSIQNKNNWNNASKRLFGSYSHSGIPAFPCSSESIPESIPEYILIPECPKRTRPSSPDSVGVHERYYSFKIFSRF